MNCFWPTGCSDRRRCAAHGSCVASWQVAHRNELFSADIDRVKRALHPPDGKPTQFQHGGGFWPLNWTLEDRRCGYDPRNHRGRGMYRPGEWA